METQKNPLWFKALVVGVGLITLYGLGNIMRREFGNSRGGNVSVKKKSHYDLCMDSLKQVGYHTPNGAHKTCIALGKMRTINQAADQMEKNRQRKLDATWEDYGQ